MLNKLLRKGDEIGYISDHDDQSFGIFCPVFRMCDEEYAEKIIEVWNARAIEAEVRAEAQPCPKCEERARLLAPKRNWLGIPKSLEFALAESTEYLLRMIDERDALQAKVAEQSAEIERVLLGQKECNDDIQIRDDHIAQQSERIAELEEENIQRLETSTRQHVKIMTNDALIEKCEEALRTIVEAWESLPEGKHDAMRVDVWLAGAMMSAINKCREAIAAHKS